MAAWAVKRHFGLPDVAETVRAARYQEAARAAGVHVPVVVRSTTGDVLADVAGESDIFGSVRAGFRRPRLGRAAVAKASTSSRVSP